MRAHPIWPLRTLVAPAYVQTGKHGGDKRALTKNGEGWSGVGENRESKFDQPVVGGKERALPEARVRSVFCSCASHVVGCLAVFGIGIDTRACSAEGSGVAQETVYGKVDKGRGELSNVLFVSKCLRFAAPTRKFVLHTKLARH